MITAAVLGVILGLSAWWTVKVPTKRLDRVHGAVYYGEYKAPDGRVTKGTIIFVGNNGVIFVD